VHDLLLMIGTFPARINPLEKSCMSGSVASRESSSSQMQCGLLQCHNSRELIHSSLVLKDGGGLPEGGRGTEMAKFGKADC